MRLRDFGVISLALAAFSPQDSVAQDAAAQALVAEAEALVERVRDASVDELVDLGRRIESFLEELGDGTAPLLELQRLAILDLAGMRARPSHPWIEENREEMRYFETGGLYYVDRPAFLALYERHAASVDAERLFWEYARRSGMSHCEDDPNCMLGLVTNGPAEYWARYPQGEYNPLAFERAAELLGGVERYACWTGNDDYTVVPSESIDAFAATLEGVTGEGLDEVLALLGAIRAACGSG